MKIERTWAMPSANTFSIRPVNALLSEIIADNRFIFRDKSKIIDPFSFGSRIGDVTNDLNPFVDSDYHLDAIDFLRKFEDKSVTGVLFDPPYSPRQVSECYLKLGKTVNMKTTQASFWSDLKKEISRIVKPCGFCVTCGWNSGGIGVKYGFSIERILLVAHGGWHNDTIITVEKRREP